MIDESNTNQTIASPGNVYEIIDSTVDFKSNDEPENAVPVLIEMTPPCDFSHPKKAKPRVLAGFMFDYSKSKQNKFKKEYLYKELWPIKINYKNKPQMIVFDFRYLGMIEIEHLQDPLKYKLIFKAKDRLFADILQKMSSHGARLGLSIIH